MANPTVNSYKRLVPGYEAPVSIAWSTSNTSPLIRIPSEKGEGSRVELRSPDPSCNPYLALAVCLKAGLHGIENKIEPPKAVNRNLFRMTAQEKEAAGIGQLPGSLKEALEELRRDELVLGVLGDIGPKFLAAKEAEWAAYSAAITPWELEQYLYRV